MNNIIIKNFLYFFSWSFLISSFMYIYQIIMSRYLSVWDYWSLTSIISYYTIICIPISALWIFITKYLSGFHDDWQKEKVEIFKKIISKNLFKIFWIYYLIIFIIILLIWNFIKINFLENFVLITTSFISLYFNYNQFINYSTKHTKLYSIIWIIDIILRIIFWLFFVVLWFWYIGAFLWFIIWNIFANLLNVYVKKKNNLENYNLVYNNIDFDYREIKSFIIPSIAFTAFWLIINNVDLILAKMYLNWENLWYYSSIIITSRIVVFWLSIFANFIIPYFTNHKKYKKIIILVYITIIFSWVVSIILFYLLPNLIVNLLFWEKYLLVSGYLFYWSIIWFLYVIINLIMNHLILIWNKKYAYIWFVFILFLSSIIIINQPINFENFIKYIMNSYILSFFLLISLIFWEFLLKRKKFKKQKYI